MYSSGGDEVLGSARIVIVCLLVPQAAEQSRARRPRAERRRSGIKRAPLVLPFKERLAVQVRAQMENRRKQHFVLSRSTDPPK